MAGGARSSLSVGAMRHDPIKRRIPGVKDAARRIIVRHCVLAVNVFFGMEKSEVYMRRGCESNWLGKPSRLEKGIIMLV